MWFERECNDLLALIGLTFFWRWILQDTQHLGFLLQEKISDNWKTKSYFSGDTLFNAGVGNCKNGGDPKVLFHTIEKLLNDLSDEVVLYPGHDYMNNNLKFMLSLLPEHTSAKKMLNQLRPEDHCTPFQTTIGEEKNINVFLHLEDFHIRKALKMPNASKEELFLELRKRRDHW